MGEESLTIGALARFHREILLPDIERIVDTKLNAMELRLNGHFDELYKRIERIETEYHFLVAGLKRVEERLDRVEQRLDRVEQRLDKLALKSELLELKARVEGLQAQVQALEGRISA